MDKINKLSLPVVILLASIILGAFFYASEVSKQKSIERQQQIELQAKTEQEAIRQGEVIVKEQKLEKCLANADDNYQANFESYCISEGRGSSCPSIKKYNNDRVLAIEKDEKADCFKKYEQ